jgi:tetratricopeptide (TPR) repeat protein
MKKQICVFIASPGDLSVERNRFREIIAELNTGFGDGANVEFIPLGWEDTLASTGRRNQSVINEEIDRADVFILVMYRRWGQPAPDAGPYSSYTEEEFYRALGRWQKEGAPEIFVFFKKVDGASEADPGVRLKKVMDFRKQLEDTRQVLYHYFEDEHSFAYQISRHLRAYAKGELPKTDSVREVFVLPSHVLDEVKKAKEAVLQQAADAKAARDASNEAYLKLNAMQLQMAQDAAALSLEGKIEYARQKFSVLVSETSDVHILSLGYEFFRRTGELEAALSVCEKMLSIVGGDSISISAVEIYINLGNLYQIRGEWARAEKMYRKAAGIAEALDDTIAMSWCLTPLGILFHAQGQVGDAEETFEKP